MSQLSRRSVMLAVPATTASLAATGAVASADPAGPVRPANQGTPTVLTFTGRRVSATLPNRTPVAPALGTTFIAYLELLDSAGKAIGDGSVSGAVVDIIAGLPIQLVTQVSVIFRLPDGELHATNLHIRLIPNPGLLHAIAITGGTGTYRTARGAGTIEHITDTDTNIVLELLLD